MIAVIVILFATGALTLVGSFMLRESSGPGPTKDSDKYLEQMLEERLNLVEHRLDDVAERSASSIKQQTAEELEKFSREKITEVNKYSDQVMDRINKNHNEVMFLYGLLSDKQKELDETVESLEQARKELRVSLSLNRVDDRLDDAEPDKRESDAAADITGENASPDIRDDGGNIKPDGNELPEVPDGQYGRRNQILDLARAGKSEVQIAKSLGMGVGEVKLVLELSKGV